MIVTTRCRRCGRDFDADRAAILTGPRFWKLCPLCRDPGPPGALAGGAPDLPPRRMTTATPEAA